MSVLLLRLAAPMQAWGDSSRFTRRETRPEPTKSGVLGLLAAAQGRRRTDPVEDLAALRFGVRVDQPGRILRDFQTAIRISDGAVMPLSYRYYLSDAVFVAGVEGDGELLAGLDEAVRAPVFPLYLGRRSCPPAGHLSLGVVDADLESALRDVGWQASQSYRREQGRTVHLDLLLDAPRDSSTDDLESFTVRDVPLSFYPERREYGWRDVVRAAPVSKENPDGHQREDFFAALGGV